MRKADHKALIAQLDSAKAKQARAKSLRPFLKDEAVELLKLAQLDVQELEEHLKLLKESKCKSCNGSGMRAWVFTCAKCAGDGHTYYVTPTEKWLKKT